MAERNPSTSPPHPPQTSLPLVPSEPNHTPDNPIGAQTELQLANFGPGTYVVQVPKDQVYRVPPPENALIAEKHRNPNRNSAKRTRCICLTVFLVFLGVVAIIGALLGGLYSILYKAKDPRFTIQRFGFKNNTRNPAYNVTLRVYNPDSRVNILYRDEGQVSLSLGQQEIGSGPFPSFRQGHGNTTVLRIVLKGKQKALPLPKEKGNVGSSVKLSLNINVPTKMKMWGLRSGTLIHEVTCLLTVDKLAEASRVISQQCQTKRR